MRQQIFSAREEQTYYGCKGIKSLYILRTLRNEGYNQSEIDLLFNTIVLPNINYVLSVYVASDSDLTLCNVSWTAVLKGNTRLSL